MLKKLSLAVMGLLLVVGALVAAFGDQLLLRVMQQRVADGLSGANFVEFSDGLDVVLCGAGSPMPDLTRSGPCVAVIAGDQVIVVDAGSGSARNLAPSGIPSGKIEAVLLTHFHSDHIDGLGELLLQRWAGGGRDTPTPVYGPQGVEQVVDGFNRAYTADFGYRIAHHGPQIISPSGAGGVAKPFVLPPAGESPVIYEHQGLKITVFAVEHPPIVPAVGYRFDYKGRSVVISGDTAPSPVLAKYAKGVDLLVHEALSPAMVNLIREASLKAGTTNRAQIMQDIQNYHTTPQAAAAIARDDKVGALLLNHIVPPLPLKALEVPFLGDARKVFAGPLWIARDGDLIDLPAGDKTITRTSLLH